MGSLAADRTFDELMAGAHVELFPGKVFKQPAKWQPVYYVVNRECGLFHRTTEAVIKQLLEEGRILEAGPGRWEILTQGGQQCEK